MHDTGQTSTQLAFFSPIHGSTMTYVMLVYLLAALCVLARQLTVTLVTLSRQCLRSAGIGTSTGTEVGGHASHDVTRIRVVVSAALAHWLIAPRLHADQCRVD